MSVITVPAANVAGTPQTPAAPARLRQVLRRVELWLAFATVVAAASGAPTPVCEALLLGFITWVPGRAVTLHHRSLHGLTMVLATVAASLATSVFVVTCFLWLHLWYPMAIFYAMAAGAMASIAWGALRLEAPPPKPGLATRARAVASSWRSLRLVDLLLLVAIGLYIAGIAGTDVAKVGTWGLVPALPLTYYIGLGIVLASSSWLLCRSYCDEVRLGAHLIALIVMIAATPALVYHDPRFPWLYKHVGVVEYITQHGHLSSGLDIYNNWPGFFALFAWFDQVSAAANPLRYAAWSETFALLVTCLALLVAGRRLSMSKREIWIGLFVFVLASWVDQLYFSPQGLAYVLGMSVLALALTWLKEDGELRWVLALERRITARSWWPGWATRTHTIELDRTPPSVSAVIGVLSIFAVTVFIHQLTPFVVAFQLSVLFVIGRLRPIWVPALAWAMCIGYLIPRLSYVNRTYGLLDSLGQFFSNAQTVAQTQHRPYDLGVRFSAETAHYLTLAVVLLALIGALRRLHARRPIRAVVALALSPILTLFLTNYGGEAEYRVFFFAVPWLALLAGSALVSSGQGSWRAVSVTCGVFALLAALLIPSYFGDDEIYVVPEGEIAAANYFYTHAPDGAALVLAAPDFPSRVNGRYSEYLVLQSEVDPNLFEYPQFSGYRQLGESTMPTLRDFALAFAHGGRNEVYLAFARSEYAAVNAYNLAPPGALAHLQQAVQSSPEWQIFYRNSTTVLYRFTPLGVKSS